MRKEELGAEQISERGLPVKVAGLGMAYVDFASGVVGGVGDRKGVGIKGHAVAEAVAEAPKGVAHALLYIFTPSFLLHPSYKSFYHTFHQKAHGWFLRWLAQRG